MKDFILSPSSLNVFMRDPAAWVLRVFYKVYGDSNIYAIRGQLAEHYVNLRIATGEELEFKEYAIFAINEVLFSGVKFSIEELKEFFEWGRKCYKILPVMFILGTQERAQGEVYGIKMGGYLDYNLGDHYIDLKTVSKLPKIVSRGKRKGLIESKKKENIRQMIIYRILTGKKQNLYFVNEGGEFSKYLLGYRDYKEHLPAIKIAIKDIKYLLTLSREDVIMEVQPDEKKMNNSFSFDWDDNLREKAREIWGLTKEVFNIHE